MIRKDGQLTRGALRRQGAIDSGGATKLGEAIERLMEERIWPQQARFGKVTQVWRDVIPAELRGHCRLGEFSGGQLKIVVDSPSFAYELRLCSRRVLEELQSRCPGARIRAVKFLVG